MAKTSISRLFKTIVMIATAGLAGIILYGCGNQQTPASENPQPTNEIIEEESVSETVEETKEDKSANIDFDKLKENNPDIWGWLTVPGTSIDVPLLQSFDEPDKYKTKKGAVTEVAAPI